MKTSFVRMPAAMLLAVLLLTPATRGWAGDPEPETLEKQIEYLRENMAEAIRSRDWKLLELVAKGFKATGLKDDKLEIEMLRAERDAALSERGGMYGGRHAIAWGLSCRAMIYGGSAMNELRELAKSNPAPAKEPEIATAQNDPEGYKAAQKAYLDYIAFAEDRNRAVFCLAMMREPGIEQRAFECLRQTPPASVRSAMRGLGGASHDLILAALVSDPKAAWPRLCALLETQDASFTFNHKIELLQGMNGIFNWPRVGAGLYSIEGDLLNGLPEDARDQLVAPFAALVKEYTPQPDLAFDPAANTLGYVGYGMTSKAHPEEVLKALDELKGKLKGPTGQLVTQLIAQAQARLRAAEAKAEATKEPVRPEKPAKAPDDF